jgi:ABC-type uncharacterized transport system
VEVTPPVSPGNPRATAPGVWRMRARKTAIGLNTGAAALLSLVVWLMANHLAYRHHVHTDLSTTQYYRLAPKTEDVLSGLAKPVTAIIFFQPTHPLYADVDAILQEFAARTPRLRVERVDPDRDPSRAEELQARHRIEKGNSVVFVCGERSRHVPADKVAEFEKKSLLNPSPRRLAFSAEPHFVSAILSVISEKKPVVYTLTGHGERDFSDTTKQHGYSEAGHLLEMENIELRPLDLARQREVPEECDALLISGPTRKLSSAEQESIGQYMRRSGRLLLMVDSGPATGLEDLLKEWGVVLGQDVVMDTRKTLTGKDLYVSRYANHPITAKMNGLTSLFFLPRSVDAVFGGVPSRRPEDQPRLTQLASCSEHGWAERDLQSPSAQFDEGVDLRGPISIAVAVEKGVAAEKGVSLKAGRLVVVGDSQFCANEPIYDGGMVLFLNSVNWLLDRADLIDIPVKPVQEVRLNLDRHDLNKLFATLVVVLPGWIAATGLLVWSRRRA